MSGVSDNCTSFASELENEIPQWKKELIQRRKNLSKLIGGANSQAQVAIFKPSSLASISNESKICSGVKGMPVVMVQKTSTSTTTTKEHIPTIEHTATLTSQPLSPSLMLHSSNEVERVGEHTENVSVNPIKCSSSNSDLINTNKQSNLLKSINSDSIELNNFNKFVNYNNNNKMVAANEMEFENFDDTSEELKYGPGIVSKLRCRYLSLALRQSNAKQRPSLNSMRRATSLNNLLDDDDSSVGGGYCDDNVRDDGSDNHHRNHDDYSTENSNWNNYQNNKSNRNKINNINQNVYNNQVKRDDHVSSFYKKNNDNKDKRSRQVQRGNDSLKRARSVEALVRYDSKAWKRDITKETPDNAVLIEDLISDQVVMNEPKITIETKIVNARERGDPRPKKMSPLLEEKERPPPDVVKEKLRIFESTANRKSRSNCRSEVAAKVATYKNIISSEKPSVVFPKPPQSPIKKPIVPPRNGQQNSIGKNPIKENVQPGSPLIENATKRMKPFDFTTRPMSPLTVDLNYRTSKLDSSSPDTNSPSLILSSPQLTPTLTKPVFRIPNSNVISSTTVITRVESPKTPPGDVSPKKINIHSPNSDSPITLLSKKIKHFNIESPKLNNELNCNNGGGIIIGGENAAKTEIYRNYQIKEMESDDSCDDFEDRVENGVGIDDLDDDGRIRKISKQTLENISKAGDSKHFKFNNQAVVAQSSSSSSSPSLQLNQKSHLPILNGNSQQVNNKNNINNEIDIHGGRQVGIIRPLVAESKLILNNDDNNPVIINSLVNSHTKVLTNREIEKNLINKGKCSELIESGNDLTANLLNKITPATTTTNTNDNNLINNTSVWGATTKKKSSNLHHQQQQENTMVFNFTDRKIIPDYLENHGFDFIRRKSNPPKPGSPGYVYIGPAPLETSTDPDDYWTMGPPSPCNVEFENGNVIIDGRSNIRNKSKEIKLNIKFDDEKTSIFEYPSESSLLDEPNDQNILQLNNAQQSSVNHKLIGSMPLGSAPLGNYTPIKASLSSSFELGITRANENLTSSPIIQAPNSSNPLLNSSFTVDQQNTEPESIQYLKPATDEQTVAWSEGTHVTDLLF